MKNFVQPGRALNVVTPSGGVVSGQAVKIGHIFGVAAYSATASAPVEIVIEGVFTLPKAASPIAFAQGDLVYWDATAGDVTSTSSGNSLIGAAVSAAGASAATADVRLNGTSV